MDAWRTSASGFGATRSPSVSQLKQRARELGVDIPSNVEKSELVDLIEQAERRGGRSASSPHATRTVQALKARLHELGLEVPTTIVEKNELVKLVEEAEKQYGQTKHPSPKKMPTSPGPKVRYRNAGGNIPPPWYQMEARSRPGHYYYVNAETGERTWELPGVPPQPQQHPAAARGAYRTTGDFFPAAPAGQSKSTVFSPTYGGCFSAGVSPVGHPSPGHGTMVPPGMPPLPGAQIPRGMPPLPGEGSSPHGPTGAPASDPISAAAVAALAAGQAASRPLRPPRPQEAPEQEQPSLEAGVEASITAQTTVAPSAEEEDSILTAAALEDAAMAAELADEDIFGSTNPALEAVKDAELLSADVETIEELVDASARHDYRDLGFREHGPPLAPPSEKRWSRQSTMSCERDPATGTVKALTLSSVREHWDRETSDVGAVHGSEITWVRGSMLGRGSLGRVFKALNVNTGQILAVKEIPIDLNNESDANYIRDLQNEVSIMQELQHPHIVRYLGHDFMDNSLYMYLEHMPGGSLTQALQQFGIFDEELLANYSKQILSGLEHMHTRDPAVVHRDIKGPNILVGADCRVKLADFGCAKRTQETMTHTMRGSIHWMAPEVIAHERYGRAADIWSFGCVAIEMGTAKVPWGKLDNQMAAVIKIGMSEETPPLPVGLSPAGEDFISMCVKRDASLRPSASTLLNHPLIHSVS